MNFSVVFHGELSFPNGVGEAHYLELNQRSQKFENQTFQQEGCIIDLARVKGQKNTIEI